MSTKSTNCCLGDFPYIEASVYTDAISTYVVRTRAQEMHAATFVRRTVGALKGLMLWPNIADKSLAVV
jgi:hypothetical protein